MAHHREARQLSLAEIIDITENLGVSGPMQWKVAQLGRSLPGFMKLYSDGFSTMDVLEYVFRHRSEVGKFQMEWLVEDLNADVKKRLARKSLKRS
jgi:hypothetical protein